MASEVIYSQGSYHLMKSSCQTFASTFLKKLGPNNYITYAEVGVSIAKSLAGGLVVRSQPLTFHKTKPGWLTVLATVSSEVISELRETKRREEDDIVTVMLDSHLLIPSLRLKYLEQLL